MRANHRAHMRIRFSKKLWDRWLERLQGPSPQDPQYRYLADGIALFRKSLAEKESRS